MKIAIIINPLKSIQSNIILDQTPFKNDINLICNKRFIPTKEFFEFVNDLLGNQFGEIENCYVICLDMDNEDMLINPINLVLKNLMNNFKKQNKDENNR